MAKIISEDKMEIPQYEMLPGSDRIYMAHAMYQESGLTLQQFATNSWGFPFIPIPEVREFSDGRIRLAPRNVSDSFLGHPIYWMDPELTARRERETEEQWCIRMFFLIGAMGYWYQEENGETYRWIDHLKASKVEITTLDVQNYHLPSGAGSRLDEVQMLTSSNVRVAPDTLNDLYVTTIDQLNEIYRSNLAHFLDRQARALEMAQAIVGKDPTLATLTPDDPQGFWKQSIEPDLFKVAQILDSRLSMKGPRRVSDLLEQTQEEMEAVRDILKGINLHTCFLTIPSLRRNVASIELFSNTMTYIMLAEESTEQQNKLYDFPEKMELIFFGGVDERDQGDYVARIVEEIYRHYEECWKRMRLALANYQLTQIGKPPYDDYTELELAIAADKTRDHNRTHSEEKTAASYRYDDLDQIFGKNRR